MAERTLIRNRLLSEFYTIIAGEGPVADRHASIILSLSQDEFDQFEEELHVTERFTRDSSRTCLLPIPEHVCAEWPIVCVRGLTRRAHEDHVGAMAWLVVGACDVVGGDSRA